MVRIANVEIPSNVNTYVGLTFIFGIGLSTSLKIISSIGIDSHKRVSSLNYDELKAINEKIKDYLIESELKRFVQSRINEHIRIGTYKGSRFSRKPNSLPVRGQRTRHNARTAKGGGTAKKKITIANKKKAPSAK